MMDQLDNVYNKIKELLNGQADSLSIVEESIDLDKQFEYLEFSNNNRNQIDEEEIVELSEKLYDLNIELDEKKQVLVDIAGNGSVNAFRVLEKYLKNVSPELDDWTKMAYRESKMQMESALLEQNQVVISSGLGGKSGKLRYFIVFRLSQSEQFSELQQGIVTREFNFFLTEQNAEVENVFFYENFTAITALIPLDVSLRTVFTNIANECNSYGNFLNNEFLITNVKKFTGEELKARFGEQNFNKEL